MRVHIAQDVLWLDVSVANTLSMDIGDRSHELIRVELHDQIRNFLLHFVELLHHSIGSVRDIVHHHIEVNFIRLISICVEALSHFNAVGVMQHLQNGKLSVLVSFVLENFLDGYCFTSFGNSCLENYSKGPITNDFLGVVGHALYKVKFIDSNLLVASCLRGFVGRRRPMNKTSQRILIEFLEYLVKFESILTIFSKFFF